MRIYSIVAWEDLGLRRVGSATQLLACFEDVFKHRRLLGYELHDRLSGLWAVEKIWLANKRGSQSLP
jgi:hypothetical protein